MLLAHKLAFSNEHITADMVEVSEFPHLATQYQVYGVPRTVINEVIQIEGAVPENALIPELMKVEDEAAMERLREQAK